MPDFKVVSDFKMTGDQPEAVAKLVEGINTETCFEGHDVVKWGKKFDD